MENPLAGTLQSILVILTLTTTSLLAFDAWPLALPLPLRTTWEPQPSKAFRWRHGLNSCLAYAFLETFWYGLMTEVSDVPIWWLFVACCMHIAVVGGFVKAAIEIVVKMTKTEEEKGGERFRDELEEEVKAEAEAEGEEKDKDAESSTLSSPALESNTSPPTPLPRKFRLLPLHPLNSTAALNAALLFYTRSLALATPTTLRENSPALWCMLTGLIICGVLLAKGLNVLILSLSHSKPETAHVSGTEAEGENKVALWLRRFANLGFLFVARAGMRWIAGHDVFSFPSADEHGNLEILSKLTDPGTNDVWPDRKVFDRAMGAIPDWVASVVAVVNMCVVVGCVLKQRRENKRREREEALDREAEGS